VLLVGDCIEQMRTLDAESIDAVITDPPYGIGFMGKGWDNFGGSPAEASASAPAAFQEFSRAWAAEAYRVLKPGGYLLAFGGTRTYHRLASGLEDAGFEIRDCLLWIYGSGFPKGLNVSKAIDTAAGAKRNVIGSYVVRGTAAQGKHKGRAAAAADEGHAPWARLKVDITEPFTDPAREWEGWGTALKPAVEPIVMARKPLIGTVVENVQRYGTGAINIDATRVGIDERFDNPGGISSVNGVSRMRFSNIEGNTVNGRWPANVLLDEEAAAMLDEQSGESKSPWPYLQVSQVVGLYGAEKHHDRLSTHHGDSGGASRFFYVAKASTAERNFGLDGLATEVAVTGALRDVGQESKPKANTHPTVKPIALMAYLIRMVARKGSVILDPFMGSGTTAVAAIQEGVAWIGCERETEYVKIIQARTAAAQAGLGLTLAEQPDTVAPGGSNLAGEPPTINAGEELELWRE
jgi:DNA modification methylase